MSIIELTRLLGWCTVINMLLLCVWLGMLLSVPDWIYQLHGRWFPMTKERFFAIHYMLMGQYKLGTLFFNLVPYLILISVY